MGNVYGWDEEDRVEPMVMIINRGPNVRSRMDYSVMDWINQRF
jgi:hypothetical protein